MVNREGNIKSERETPLKLFSWVPYLCSAFVWALIFALNMFSAHLLNFCYWEIQQKNMIRAKINSQTNAEQRSGTELFSLFLFPPSNLSKTVWKMHPKRLFMNFRRDLFSFNERNGCVMPFFFHPLRPTIDMKDFLSWGYFNSKMKFFWAFNICTLQLSASKVTPWRNSAQGGTGVSLVF